LTVTFRDEISTARAPPPTVTVRDGAAGARVARDFDGTGVSGPGSDVGAGDEGDAVPDAGGPDADDEDVGAGDEVAACPEPPEPPEQPATANAASAPATSAAVLPEPPVTA
jgi:hypothetical protein